MNALRISGKIPPIPVNYDAELQHSYGNDDIAVMESKRKEITSITQMSSLLQYELDVYKAFVTFQHQVVFDPIRKQVSSLPINSY